VKPAADAAAEASTTKSRRGRRGGRRVAAKRAAAAQAEASAVSPLDTAIERVEIRAPVEQFMEQQLAVLKGLQGSLSAIEARLTTMIQPEPAERARVGVFVDVPNIMYAAERVRTTLDYEKMLAYLVRGRHLVRASAYAPISDDPQEPIATQKFVQPFMGHGYSLITKPLKRYGDGTIKANFDVELAIDILIVSDRLDVVILVSGDGDFRRLVELVASKGVRVEVAAFGDSTAAELRTAADHYTDLKDCMKEFRR
jgi:uncharacterized LabA/DUF88 family protein